MNGFCFFGILVLSVQIQINGCFVRLKPRAVPFLRVGLRLNVPVCHGMERNT